MSEQNREGQDPPDTALARRVDRACNRFEIAWQSGRPAIEEYLAGWVEPDRAALLRELILLDVHYRQNAGEPCAPADYRIRFPDTEFDPRTVSFDDEPEPGGARGCGPAAAASGAGAPPLIAGYELLHEIGRGGMGVVYRARDGRLNRVVALKMILTGQPATAREVRRFRTEAENAGRLDHPNIVPIYEVGEHAGRHYFTMKLIDGGSLAQRLARGSAVPLREWVRLLAAVARAVHFAHQHGLLHRDLKPANVLVDGRGEPQIIDFGLARPVGGASELTHSGAILGTPSYMAPEQAGGENREVTTATDVYGLGSVLYEILAGRPPFQGATALDVLLRVRYNDPIPPGKLRARVDRDLETVCLTCLAKEPQRRYGGSAAALADDLERWLAGEPIRGRRTTALARAWRGVRRHPAIASLLAVVALLLALVLSVTLTKNAELRQANTDLGHALTKAERLELQAQDETWQAYLATMHSSALAGRRGQRVDGLRVARKALELPGAERRRVLDLRTETLACLCLPDVEVDRELDGTSGTPAFVEFDAAFTRYACADANGVVRVRRVEDCAEVALLPSLGKVPAYCGLIFSPDGCFLGHRYEKGNRTELKLWRLEGGAEPVAVLHVEEDISCASFRPDGRLLAIAVADGRIRLHDPASGGLEQEIPPTLATGTFVSFHPRLPHVLVVTSTAGIRTIDFKKGQVLQDRVLPGAGMAAWHPTGNLLAVPAGDLTIHLLDAGTFEDVLPPLKGHRSHGLVCAVNRAGDLLASTDWGNILRLWDLRTGSPVFDTPLPMFTNLRFGPEDRWLGAGIQGDRIQLLHVSRGRELTRIALGRTETDGGEVVQEPFAVRADSRVLAGTTARGTVLIDLLRQTEAGRLAAATAGQLRPLQFEADGGLLTTGEDGLLSWPLTVEGPDANRHTLGPPRQIVDHGAVEIWGVSADARVVAMPGEREEGLVVHLDRPERLLPLVPQQDVRYCAVSPDGRYAATGSHWRGSVRVWNTSNAALLRELLPEAGRPLFSPDRAWLAAATDSKGGECRLWKVGTWEAGPVVRCAVQSRLCFSADGQVLALTADSGALLLVEPATGRELARLSLPDRSRLLPACFTPDGTRLIGRCAETGYLYVWDLQLLRTQLRELGLDWDRSPLPAPLPVAVPPALPPLSIRENR